MKAAIYTLGCKVNHYESEQLAELLTKSGYLMVSPKEEADVYIINSCTVTSESSRKTRQAVRRFKAAHPEAVVVLTGCDPQAFPKEAERIAEADIITGNSSNGRIVDLIDKFLQRKTALRSIAPHVKDEKFSGDIISGFSGHTRAFLKIQDGCNRFCTYCAIPFARGRSRSKPLEDIERELKNLAGGGFKEVVFVGINLSAYGRDIGLSLGDAVRAAQNTEGIERIRLGSLEPDHITDELIASLASCSKFCPQFHLSLQSGSDSVLKRMNRHYTAGEFEALTIKLRRGFKNAALTTDIITGFPGESEDEFAQTVDFAEKIRFEKVHVFPFSVREGTRAAQMENQIPNEVKNARAAALSKVCDKIRCERFAETVGTTLSVLFEAPKNGIQNGYGENYIPVKVETEEKLSGQIRDVLITKSDEDCCFGTVLPTTL